MPWSVKGVTTDARDRAKDAAGRDGLTMGGWLSDVIRRVGAAEAAGRPLAPRSQTVPDSAPESAPESPTEAESTIAAAELIAETDAEEMIAQIADRIDRSETRLIGVLATLEEILERLTERLDRLESEPPSGIEDRGGTR